MNDPAESLLLLLPARTKQIRGFVLAVALWLFYMVVTAYTSAVTLLDRVASTDVMKAASGGAWSGRIAWEVVTFLGVQILLHVFFATLTWLLACASAIVSPVPRQKFGRVVVGWFCVFAGAALIYNALWYPRTLFGAYYHDALATRVGPLLLGQVVYLAAIAFSVLILTRAALILLRRATSALQRGVTAAALLTSAGVLSWTFWPAATAQTVSAASASRPNIILLGIDSLRLEQLQRFGGTGVTPNLDRFLAQADVFRDTTTPAARTFSSWVALLTGRSPTVTGARFNLAERSSVRANPTIADVLRKSGYKTIYSTDEVRFANIDETFGFDQVVTPRIGASDFLIGTYNELPLASLFINTRIGKWLFPFSYANRGVATMFQPETFVHRLDQEVSFDQPTFFIAHLTAAHWPYYTGNVPFGVSKPKFPNDRPLYRIGLQTADRMFGDLVAMLERKGALQNALVVVLSDHGEALNLPSDSFFDDTFKVAGMRAPLKMIPSGHGQSVLSKSQYQILLSFRPFGGARKFAMDGRNLLFPATAEDITPTLLEYLQLPGDPLSATGRSLMSVLDSQTGSDERDSDATQRVRFTETDLSVLPGPGGEVDEVATARQNSMFFEVDPKTARLHIRPRYAPLATAFKERAAFTSDYLLAAMPAGPTGHQYIFIDFPEHRGQLLLERPGAHAPDAQRLWDALHEHYPGELYTPVSITPADWPRIGAEWEKFAAATGHDLASKGAVPAEH